MIGFLVIAGVRKEIGDIGRVKPAQYPHVFPEITAILDEPKDPIFNIAAL
jgi:hypothetical protein